MKKIFLNNLFWGFILWLIGYVLGIIFFALVPQKMIGWCVMPLGSAITLVVLFKKIQREKWLCYLGMGIIWTAMAVILDYIFLVKLFQATNYYKPDVYLYYALTFMLPVLVGWYKKSKGLIK